MPAALLSQPEVRWVVGSQGHALELPKAGVFISLAQRCQLGRHLAAGHFWELQGMVSTGDGTLLPPFQNGTVWARAALPSTGLMGVPCLGQASPVPPDTQSPQERTARNTENPPLPSALHEGHIL